MFNKPLQSTRWASSSGGGITRSVGPFILRVCHGGGGGPTPIRWIVTLHSTVFAEGDVAHTAEGTDHAERSIDEFATQLSTLLKES